MSASPEPEYDELLRLLPGLAGLEKSALARRELTAAWRRGLTGAPKGMLHAPSLMAPLGRHDRINDPGTQATVTLPDALHWTEQDATTERSLAWRKSLVSRAERYADALVVPSHAVADAVAEHADFGDRVRVIPPGPPSGLAIPSDALERLTRLELPRVYALTFAGAQPRHRLLELMRAMTTIGAPLVVAGLDDDLEPLREESGLPAASLITVSGLDAEDLAATQAGASVFVHASRGEGFPRGVLEAFTLGTPVVASDSPSDVEVAADAALIVDRADEVDGWRTAIERVLSDGDLADRLRVAGRDRVQAYSWRDAAEKVWQLHADL